MKKRIIHLLKSFLQKFIIISGVIFIILLILSFTRIPFDVHRSLGEYSSDITLEPEIIIMLGGSGMPSESNLIRLYYTAEISNLYPNTSITIAHPEDTSVTGLMRDYLVSAGIQKERINFMLNGTNTREQAVNLLQQIPSLKYLNVVLITSPENMLRTIKVFHKAGVKKVRGVAAFENAMFIDLSYNHKKIGGKSYVPDVSGSNDLRYNFWNYLKLEIICLREFAAIAYYKLNGWI